MNGLIITRFGFTAAKSVPDPMQAGAGETEPAEEAEESRCDGRSGGGHTGDPRG